MYKLCCINYQVDPVDKLETLDKGINLLFFFFLLSFFYAGG